jgi:tetratricopeptide (TPR) repeat protein
VNPSRLSTYLGKAELSIQQGKTDDIIQIAKSIIELNPNDPTGYFIYSRAKKFKGDESLNGRLLEFTQEEGLDDQSKIAVSFALGKLFDDQNNYSSAFKNYAEGNKIRNSNLSYSAEADAYSKSKLIEFFNADFFKTHQHLGTDLNLPIIIVGMPRSSTTLTEQIISSHPEVMGAGEVIFWGKAPLALPLRVGTGVAYPECISEMLPEQAFSIASMYESTLRKIAGPNAQVKHITDKMPHNFLNLGLIAMLFPKVKIIHTKRNPIDTCLSIFFQNFNDMHPYAFDLKNLGAHYKQYERIMRHWHEVLPGRIMDIHYEDTISDPEYWSRKLIEHVGLEWDDACLAPHKLERTVKTASHWQVRQPIYKTSVQRWKNYEEFLGPLIEALKD